MRGGLKMFQQTLDQNTDIMYWWLDIVRWNSKVILPGGRRGMQKIVHKIRIGNIYMSSSAKKHKDISEHQRQEHKECFFKN